MPVGNTVILSAVYGLHLDNGECSNLSLSLSLSLSSFFLFFFFYTDPKEGNRIIIIIQENRVATLDVSLFPQFEKKRISNV